MSKRGRDEGPFKVPDSFGDEEGTPADETDDRVASALEGGVEVSEENRSHTFVRQADEDTGDDAWGGGIIAAMYSSDDAEPEPEPEVRPATPSPAPVVKGPDLHQVGSVDGNNPITFIDNPLDGLTPSAPAAPAPEPAAPEPATPAPTDFLADIGGSDEPVPFVDGPSPVIDDPMDFFSDAPQKPTEEVPSAIFDDVSQPSAIPSMSGGVGYEEVVAAPMEEMVIGAPTPQPILREVGEQMPDLRKRLAEKASERANETDDEDGFSLPVVPIIILCMLIMGLAGGGFLIYQLASGPDTEAAEQAAISGDMRPPSDLPVVTFPDVMQGDERDIPDVDHPPDAMSRPVPVEEPAPQPKRPRAVKPAGEPKTGVAALTSRITVTSNRRAMISLDGVPHGHAPIDIRVGAGSYTVSAVIPGRVDTEQTKDVSVGRDQTQAIGFVF